MVSFVIVLADNGNNTARQDLSEVVWFVELGGIVNRIVRELGARFCSHRSSTP